MIQSSEDRQLSESGRENAFAFLIDYHDLNRHWIICYSMYNLENDRVRTFVNFLRCSESITKAEFCSCSSDLISTVSPRDSMFSGMEVLIKYLIIIPLPNDPGELFAYAVKLGLGPSSAAFAEVFSFEEEGLSCIPQPIFALMFLFPVGPPNGILEQRYKTVVDLPSPVPWFTQTDHIQWVCDNRSHPHCPE
jgi:hypothetical protein